MKTDENFRNAQKCFEDENYSSAFENLYALAKTDSAKAVTLYKTYRRGKMYGLLGEWADEVISGAREYVLLMPEIYNGVGRSLLEEMEKFEREYNVDVDRSIIPNNLTEANGIIAAESLVRPANANREFIELVDEVVLRRVWGAWVQRQHPNDPSLLSLSGAEKRKRLRGSYSTNVKVWKRMFHQVSEIQRGSF